MLADITKEYIVTGEIESLFTEAKSRPFVANYDAESPEQAAATAQFILGGDWCLRVFKVEES